MTYFSQDVQATDCRAPRISILRLIQSRLTLMRSRSRLSQLSDRELADIGISRRAAATESRRSVWDVPASWRD